MPFRLLSESGQGTTKVYADVCVVGAGIAGLLAAVRLARSHQLRVVVVESGIHKDDAVASALDRIENPSPNYEGALRARGPGGTSARWAGKLLPLSSSDVQARPWIEAPSWPFGLDELAHYTPELERLMGVDRESSEEDAGALLDPRSLLPHGDPDFTARWPKRPSAAKHDLAHVLRSELRAHENLIIWLGATVTKFRFAPGAERVAEIEATNQAGQALVIEARQFLLAAGTLESTRLMLLADRHSGGTVSRATDVLGRHFNDHLGLNVARLRPIDRIRTNRMLSDRWLLGAARHLHFELRPAVQERHRIGSSYFDFGIEVPDASALSQTRLAIGALRRGDVRGAATHSVTALPDLPNLLWTARWRFVDKQKYWPTNAIPQVKIWIEQLPQHRNRISLSEKSDALGQPLIAVDFHRSEFEERSLRTCIEKLRGFWARHAAPFCELEWDPRVLDPAARVADAAIEQAHPAGSTRMGRDPATSVVDPHLRVHAIANLSIASASVFPSSGSANPTFTIMQLAMRAADAIGASFAAD
jgi:choline dehydrogenase-like flavoprotein